jgi:hypothetical protein
MVLKICIVGTKQSGSTRLYNLVRLLYNNCNIYSCYEYQHDLDCEYDIIISKVHDCEISYLKKFDIVILPIRDIRDSAISSRMRFNEHIIDNCLFNIEMVNKFTSYSHYIFKYENYNLDYIHELCQFLKIDKTKEEILNIMSELDFLHKSKKICLVDNPDDDFYKITLLSQHHNTSNGQSKKYKTFFSPEENQKLLENPDIYNFLHQFNYLD